MTALKADDPVCSIGRRMIVFDIDLDVQLGTMTALVGVNGVGKSILIRVLAGIRPATMGHMEISGRDLFRFRPREQTQLVVLVAREEVVPKDLSLSEMIVLGRLPHLVSWQIGGFNEKRIVAECLEMVGLTHLVNRRCGHLSGGERRRVMLAKGPAQGTDLLLLDKSINHLDVHHRLYLLQTMRAIGRTIVALTHDLDLAIGWFGRIVTFADGGIHVAGTPREVMTVVNLESAFKVWARQVPAVGNGIQYLTIDGLVPPGPIDPEP